MLNSKGTSVFELLVALGMIGMMMGMAVSDMRELNDPLQNGSAQLMGYFKQVRARALSTTSAYIIEADSASTISSRYANTCSDATWTDDPALDIELPFGATMTDSAWSICFNSRGFPDVNVTLTLTNSEGQYKTVEVLLGGAVRLD